MERADREKRNMTELLERQRKRISKIADKYDTMPMLDFGEDEQRQLEADRRAWKHRLEAIERELKSEPRRIDEIYTVHATRIEPIGLVYLWPRTG